MKKIELFPIVLLLLAACNPGRPPADRAESLFSAPQTVPLNIEEGYAVNMLTGDSIPPLLDAQGQPVITGKPIPAQGKVLDPDSVAPPERVKAGTPKMVPAHTNVHKVPEVLTVIPVDQEALRRVPFGSGNPASVLIYSTGDTIPTGVPLPAGKGKTVPAILPKPVKALASRYRDNAVNGMQYIDVDQGLSSSQVLSMLEDSSGNLWILYNSGTVSRYDGEYFTHFTEHDGLGIFVHSMLEDSMGNIWFGTGDQKGMVRYNGKSFTYFSEEDGLRYGASLLIEDSKGNIWFNIWGSGVSRYDGKSFTHFTEKEGLINNRVKKMLEDREGNLWFATDLGLSRFDGTHFTQFTEKDGLSHFVVTSMAEDNEGNLWFGTWGKGVDRYDGKSFTHFTTKEGLSNQLIMSILQDHSGNLWFAGISGGVSCYDGQSFTHFTTKEGLSNDQVYSIMEDRNGSLWFSTFGGGINRYDQDNFTHFREAAGLIGNPVTAMLEDKAGNLWFVTLGKGVSRYDGKYFYNYTVDEGLSHNIFRAITEDHTGNIWLGTWGAGVSRYDGEYFTHFDEQAGLSYRGLVAMLEDRNGNLWFGTAEGGLSRYDPDANEGQGSFTHFTRAEGLLSNSIWSLLEDRKGHLWIGTVGGGVTQYDGQHFTHFTEREGLSDNSIKSMMQDREGNLWFGTNEGGLNRFDGQHFTYFTKEQGLSDNSISSILEDQDGNLWLGTDNGLNIFFKGATSKAWDKDVVGINTFGRQDGLRGVDFGRGVLLDRDNRAWWGMVKTLTMLDLNKFDASESTLEVSLVSLDINEQFLDFTDGEDLTVGATKFDSIQAFYSYPLGLALSHELNHLTFHFSAFEFKAPSSIKYSFKIEGLDDWSTPASDAEADYRNLPAGSYTFKVRAIGAAGIWSEPFVYAFTIWPPWWRSWWAYSLYALFAFGLFMSLRNYELRRLRTSAEAKRLLELDSVKTRLYNNITHEFRTPLTVIMGMADEIEKTPGEAKRMIRRSGANLLRLVNQMLDLSKLETGKLELKMVQGNVVPYLQYLTESFHSYAGTKDIQLLFYQEVEQLVMDYDEEKLEQIVSNLLSNAIKFTPENGKVIVHVNARRQNEQDALIVKVKDTGIGMPAAELPHVFNRFYQVDDSHTRSGEGTGIGLALTRELVQLMQGKISVKSVPGKGTEFMVVLPVKLESKLTTESVSLPSQTLSGRFVEQAHPPSFLTDDSENEEMAAAGEELPLLLIIEDNPDISAYIQTCLQGQYTFAQAENGQIGIDKALELVPDIIISDVMMPQKDGFEVCHTLKHDERTSHIPVILLTAKATTEDKIAGLQTGADAYLVKPFDRKELSVRLRKMIELRLALRKRYEGVALPAALTRQNEPVKIEDAFLLRMTAIVEKRLDDADFTIPQFCRDAGMSRTQLHRKLKALTGKSATIFIRSIRLQKARELLQTTDLNVSEVAYEVGFRDPAYFSTSFFEEFGLTPSETRK